MTSSPNELVSIAAVGLTIVIDAPHVYLTQSVIEQLFGDHYRLHRRRQIDHDDFLARESVTLIGPRGRLNDVAVFGPPRRVNQIEISRSDGRLLGVDPPLRGVGDVEDTPGIEMQGPRCQVRLERGVTCLQRHVSMHSDVAQRLGYSDRDRVDVAKASADGQVLFSGVVVRLSAEDRLEFHVDTDDACAAGIIGGERATISYPWKS